MTGAGLPQQQQSSYQQLPAQIPYGSPQGYSMNNSGYTSPTIFLRHSRCRVMTIPSDGSNLPHTFPGAAIPIYLAPSNNRTLLIIPCNSNYKTMQDILRSLTLTERSDKVGKEGPAALPTTTTTTSVRLDLP